MTNTFVPILGYILCFTSIIASGFVYFTADGVDTGKATIVFIAFVFLMLHGCYRIHETKASASQEARTDSIKTKLFEADSIGGFLSVVFHPKEMTFETSFCIFLILAVALFGNPSLFLIIIVVCVSTRLLKINRYYRYWKSLPCTDAPENSAKAGFNKTTGKDKYESILNSYSGPKSGFNKTKGKDKYE